MLNIKKLIKINFIILEEISFKYVQNLTDNVLQCFICIFTATHLKMGNGWIYGTPQLPYDNNN